MFNISVSLTWAFQSFLFFIALYLWKSWKRRYARRNRIAPTEPLDEMIISDIGIEDSIIAQEDIRVVRNLIAALPEKLRIPTILFYSMEMSVADIAATLRRPVGTVKSRLHKARKILEKGLMGIGYGQ